MQEEILIPLIIFSTIFGVSYVYLTTQNKERLALIERGLGQVYLIPERKEAWGPSCSILHCLQSELASVSGQVQDLNRGGKMK